MDSERRGCEAGEMRERTKRTPGPEMGLCIFGTVVGMGLG